MLEGDILVLILGEKYSSIVLKECDKALQNEIPVLCFNKVDVEKEEKLQNYIKYLKDYIVYREFSSLKELKIRLKECLIDIISDCFRNYQKIYRDVFSWLDLNVITLSKKSFDILKEEYHIEKNNSKKN